MARSVVIAKGSKSKSSINNPSTSPGLSPVMHAGTVGGDVVNYLASWRSNEKRLLFSNRRGNPYSENKVVRHRLWPNFGRFRYSSLWDARLPALARELACFKWRVAKGHTGSVAACRCEYDNAGLRSRPRIRTARRGGESGPFVDRCGQVRKEVSKCMVGAVGVEHDPQTTKSLGMMALQPPTKSC